MNIGFPSHNFTEPNGKPSFAYAQRFGLNYRHPFTNNLIGCWIFNEYAGLNIIDHTFNRNNIDGQSTGTIAWDEYGLQFANASGAMAMTGSGVAGPNIYQLANQDITIVLQYYRNGTPGNYDYVIAHGWNASSDIDWGIIYTGGAGDYDLGIICGGSYSSSRSAAAEATIGQIVNVAATYQDNTAGGANLYINGVLDHTIDAPDVSVTSRRLVLNARSTSSGTGFIYQGPTTFRYLYIYDRVLSADEINAIHAAPYDFFVRDWLPGYAAAGGTAIDLADASSVSEVSDPTIQRIRNLSLADISSASEVTDLTLGVVVQTIPLSISDLSVASDISDYALQRIRNLSLGSVSSNSSVISPAIQRIRNIGFGDVSSSVDITNYAISRLRSLSIASLSSLSEVTGLTIGRIRNLSLSDVSSSSQIIEDVIQRIRNLSFADLSSNIDITNLNLTLQGIINLANLAASAEITSPVIQRIRNLSFIDVSSDSVFDQIVLNKFKSLIFADVSSGSQITGPVITAATVLSLGDLESLTQITSPTISRLRTLSISDLNALSEISEVLLSSVSAAVLGNKYNRVFNITDINNIRVLPDDKSILLLPDGNVIKLLR